MVTEILLECSDCHYRTQRPAHIGENGCLLITWPTIRCGCSGKMNIVEVVSPEVKVQNEMPDSYDEALSLAAEHVKSIIDKDILASLKAEDELPDVFKCAGGCQDCNCEGECVDNEPDVRTKPWSREDDWDRELDEKRAKDKVTTGFGPKVKLGKYDPVSGEGPYPWKIWRRTEDVIGNHPMSIKSECEKQLDHIQQHIDNLLLDKNELHQVELIRDRTQNEVYRHLLKVLLNGGLIEFPNGTMIKAEVIS